MFFFSRARKTALLPRNELRKIQNERKMKEQNVSQKKAIVKLDAVFWNRSIDGANQNYGVFHTYADDQVEGKEQFLIRSGH